MRRQAQSQGRDEVLSGHKRRRMACKPCRQAKLRCEPSTHGSMPCSRCCRTGEECQMDSEYKRVNKRAKIEELEKQVQQLRSSVESARPGEFLSPVPTHRTASVPDSILSSPDPSLLYRNALVGHSFDIQPNTSLENRDGELSLQQDMPELSTNNQQTTFQQSMPLESPIAPGGSRTLDHITIGQKEIDSLFRIYFQHYHDYLPLLDSTISPNGYYTRSPILFWVIIYISSRRYEDEPSLLVSLAAPVRKLLWHMISSPSYSSYVIRAILLLCHWPFPTSSLWTDPSSMLVAIAQTMVMRLGLHRPELIQDFSRTKRRLDSSEILEAIKTWSVCYIAGQSISLSDGQRPPLSFDWSIDRVCDMKNANSNYTIPDTLKHQVLIYRFSARVNNYMSDHRHSPTGLLSPGESVSLLALLGQELSDLSGEITDQMSAVNKILLDSAGLQLYIYYFLQPAGCDARKKGLLKAFNLALALLSKVQDADAASNLMAYAPVAHHRTTGIAAMVILKIVHSSYSRYVDVDRGKRLFNAALSLIRRASIEDNDLPGRTSKILAQLWSAQAQNTQLRQEEPSLRLKTRSSASLLHDSLWIWREKFGGQSSSSGTHTPAGTAEQLAQQPPTAAVRDAFDGQFGIGSSQCELDDSLDVEGLFDVGMLSLLPFNLDGDPTLPAMP